MDARVKKLKTPEECKIFARNAKDRGHPELAIQALGKATELRAEKHEAKSPAEKEALQAIYAYEEVLTKKNGKRTRASRTWPMVERCGIIEAVERAVIRSHETQGYLSLVEMGLQEFAFEAVILRHPQLFSDAAVKISNARMSEWRNV